MRILLPLLLLACSVEAATVYTTVPPNPVTSGLVGYWALNTNAGNLLMDTSGNGNTGYTTNSPVWTNGVIGPYNASALSFNGTTQNAGASNSFGFLQTTPFSMSLWLQTTTTSIIAWSTWNVNVTAGWRLLVINGAMQFDLLDAPGAFGRGIRTTTTVTNGQWHHCVMTFSGNSSASGMAFFIDGVSASASELYNTDPGTLSGTSLTFASQLVSGAINSPWNGLLDDFRLYNRALSAAEVTQLYNFRNHAFNTNGTTQFRP